MRRLLTIAIMLTIVASAFAQAQRPFGSIDYVEGSASLVRAGKSLGEANIGDDVLPDDMIRTAGDGLVIINLDRSTGMRGNLTIKPRTVIYIRLQPDAAGPKSTIDLISGQIGSKLAKLSGNPSLNVSTDTVAMGVRGTAFTVSTSVNGSILILCTEGEVVSTDGAATLSVPAGRAVEKKGNARLRLVPVAISSPETFESQWIAEEIEAFRANAPKAMADYEKRYSDLLSRFHTAFDPLQKSEILSKWIREDVAGVKVNPNDPVTLREKKEMIGPILEVRKILFIFERIYYRILELEGIISGTSMERTPLRPGLTAGDFIRKVQAEAPSLERRMYLFRYAEKLYELRNAGGAGVPGMGGSDEFFGSDDDFFGSGDDF
jgi:hypothetical protein